MLCGFNLIGPWRFYISIKVFSGLNVLINTRTAQSQRFDTTRRFKIELLFF